MAWPDVTCCFINEAERREREENRRAAIAQWRAEHAEPQAWPEELSALSRSFFPPGLMWFCPWYFDPAKQEDREKLPHMISVLQAEPERRVYLSIHYLTSWALLRPPINVVCPDGRDWCPDSKSSNGSGWTVTGDVPRITCSPSIWTDMPRGYHGFLTKGVFRSC